MAVFVLRLATIELRKMIEREGTARPIFVLHKKIKL